MKKLKNDMYFYRAKSAQQGQAALSAVLFFIALMLAIVVGFSSLALTQERVTRTNLYGKQSYFTAEAAQEDVVYRLVVGMNVDDTEDIILSGHTASTTVTTVGSDRTVVSRGDASRNIRTVRTDLTVSTGVAFNFGIQSGDGGLLMENNSKVLGNVYSNGPIIANDSPDIEGDAISAGPDGLFQNHHATGAVQAHTITGSLIEGDAYYDTISATTVLGEEFPGSPDQPTSTLPISEETIDAWKAEAEAGGTISSPCPYIIDDDATVGPVKINCDLEIKGNNPDITIAGSVWVVGNIKISNSPQISIASSLGKKSLPVIADNPADRLTSSKIEVTNSPDFFGSGSTGSYILLLSQNESSEAGGGEVAISLANFTKGDLLVYAGHGEVLIQNNIELKEVTAYKIHTRNFAEVTYDSGLANLLFSSGPAGGFNILDWREIE